MNVKKVLRKLNKEIEKTLILNKNEFNKGNRRVYQLNCMYLKGLNWIKQTLEVEANYEENRKRRNY